MKKLLFMVALILGGALNSDAFAGHQQEIPMQIFNNGAASQGGTYAPPRPWYIVQDDYTLTFPAFEDDYVLELRDHTGKKMFSNNIAGAQYSIETSGWESGIYIFRTTIGEDVFVNKILKK